VIDMAKFICKNCGGPFEFFVEYAPYMPPSCPTCESRFTEYIGPDNMGTSVPTKKESKKKKGPVPGSV